jgi:cell division protein FtsB
LVIAIGLLAAVLAGTIVALVLVASDASSRDKKHAQAVERLRVQIEESRSALTGQTGEHAQLSKLRDRTKQIEDCLPELQDELGSLTIDRQNLIISPGSQVSRVCSPTLYGSTPGE